VEEDDEPRRLPGGLAAHGRQLGHAHRDIFAILRP
jgi:hypothetical protein